MTSWYATPNEELAALRATLLAAQRQPLAVKVAQARLSALLADGDDLLPYVLSRSCSDPRDRSLARENVDLLVRLEEFGASRTAEEKAITREMIGARCQELRKVMDGDHE